MREQHGNIYIAIREIDSLWELAVQHRELSLVLVTPWKGGMGWEMDEGFRREGTYLYL